MEVSYQGRNPGEDDHENINENNFTLTALLQMCEELSEVATVLNEDDLNPFYVFLNPIRKFKEYRKMQNSKMKLHLNSQFIT
jgi:hypothetical protein